MEDKELFDWFIYEARLECTKLTPYKHKYAYYKKKAHYVNGIKVSAKLYNEIQNRQIKLFKQIDGYDYLEGYRQK